MGITGRIFANPDRLAPWVHPVHAHQILLIRDGAIISRRTDANPTDPQAFSNSSSQGPRWISWHSFGEGQGGSRSAVARLAFQQADLYKNIWPLADAGFEIIAPISADGAMPP